MNFSELHTGDKAIIVGFDKTISDNYRYKLLAMGLTPKTKFEIIRMAPLGDPIEIRARDFLLVVRKKEAKKIMVEKI